MTLRIWNNILLSKLCFFKEAHKTAIKYLKVTKYLRVLRALPKQCKRSKAVGKTEKELPTLRQAHEHMASQIGSGHDVLEAEPLPRRDSLENLATSVICFP